MTKTFANSLNQATKAITEAVETAVSLGLLLPTDRATQVEQSLRTLRIVGSVSFCFGEKIILTERARDAMRAKAISKMSAKNFEQFAVGL